MSLSTLALRGRIALRGKLQFRAADGSILKEVDIVDGALPIVGAPPALAADVIEAPEPPHAHTA
jgi:hypothetical protein